MGSKLSKAVQPRGKAVASSDTAVPDTNASAPSKANSQDVALHIPEKYGYDDIQVATSNTTPAVPRRNSEPVCSTSTTQPTNMEDWRDRLTTFNLFLEGHRMRSIEYEATDLSRPPFGSLAPFVLAPPPPPEPELQCIICCAALPDESDPRYIKEVTKPCRSCSSMYCGACMKTMFVAACTDLTRMPPRCCTQIHLHHARPFLTEAEVIEFKSKYEEWSTQNPFYCPVPTCSVFIPERLMPQHVRSKGKQRVDSGIGTPVSNTFGCPTCEAEICAGCRQPAHPGTMCNVAEFGIDAKTAALLKSWGYKKCPKCGHGVKRMFGCNHMECRCGAHFCWGCMQSQAECEGGCYDDGSDSESVYSLSDEAEETQVQPANDNNETPAAVNASVSAATNFTSEASAPDTPSDNPPAQRAPRPVNLDAGPRSFWESEDYNFGPEPTDDYQDAVWACSHDFNSHYISLADALTKDSAALKMECVKCWSPISPEVETPHHGKVVPGVSAPRRQFHGRGHGRGLRRGGRGRGRGRYTPPRGLFRADATVGTAPHLTTIISPLSQSQPAPDTIPMEDIQHSDRVVDTYGNIITTTEPNRPRRASVQWQATACLSDVTPSVFASGPAKLNFAYECFSCGMLVCEACRDEISPPPTAEELEASVAALNEAEAASAQNNAEAGAVELEPEDLALIGLAPNQTIAEQLEAEFATSIQQMSAEELEAEFAQFIEPEDDEQTEEMSQPIASLNLAPPSLFD